MGLEIGRLHMRNTGSRFMVVSKHPFVAMSRITINKQTQSSLRWRNAVEPTHSRETKTPTSGKLKFSRNLSSEPEQLFLNRDTFTAVDWTTYLRDCYRDGQYESGTA
jgi:hypothetical protein